MKFKAQDRVNGRSDRDEERIDELEDIKKKISRMQSRGENVGKTSREIKRHRDTEDRQPL